MSMGRRRQSNHNLPPRMHKKGAVYYHVSTMLPRKRTRSGDDLGKAKSQWAQIENAPANDRSFSAAADRYLAECMHELAPDTQKSHIGQIYVLKQAFGHMELRDTKPCTWPGTWTNTLARDKATLAVP